MRNPDNRPYVRPVTKISLSEASPGLRIALIVVCLLIGAAALAVGLNGLLNRGNGWQEVEASASERNLSQDFILRYDFGRTGAASSVERREVSQIYTDAMERAYVLFSKEEEAQDNLWAVNAHANEAVTVDPVLYDALETVQKYESRYLYLAPVYAEYQRMFLSETAEEASRYDPRQDPELAAWLQELAAFANDPGHIDLELLGGGQVRLKVSETYLNFAAEYELESLLDFSWTRNAFVVDYVAQMLQEKGCTSGYITSYDGFTRNLDRGGEYSLNVFSRLGNAINLPAVMHYESPISLVSLRDYAMTEQDRWHYFSFPDGHIATTYLDPADGRSKSSLHDLIAYSYEVRCADVLLQIAPLFIADRFDQTAVQDLAKARIYAVWSKDAVLCYNDAGLRLELKENETASYSKSYQEP